MSSRAPAPGELETVQAFVNTVDIETATDELASASALRAWLAGRELIAPTARCTAGDLQRAVDVREALRELLLANAGEADPGAPSAVLDAAAARARLTLRFGDRRGRLVPSAGGVDGAVGRLLAIVFAAMADGTWGRLKAC